MQVCVSGWINQRGRLHLISGVTIVAKGSKNRATLTGGPEPHVAKRKDNFG